MEETRQPVERKLVDPADPEIKRKTSKQMMWLGVVTIVMIFAGLTSGYVVLQADDYWVKHALPDMFWVSTGIILVSSLTLYWALTAAKKGNMSQMKTALITTVLLGLGFAGSQYLSWKELNDEGKFFVGTIDKLKGNYGEDFIIVKGGEALQYVDGKYYAPDDEKLEKPLNEQLDDKFNKSGSFLFVLSGLHLLHMLGGLIYLVVVMIRGLREKYKPDKLLDLELCSIYWHFLDALWIYLFLFLLFIR